MARYTGPMTKKSRRLGVDLVGGDAAFERRPYPPGQHGRARIYGVLEKQFRGYYDEANRRQGKTGENLLRILESRLDNVVYRAGFAKSRDMARQLVRHGHIVVNGKKVDIPSYRVTDNDIIEVRERSLELTPFVVARAEAGERTVPAWIEVIPNRMRILVHSLPARQVIDTPVQELLIVELYSK